jgi:DNA-directed RNA polymerase I subunit RPA1
VFKAYKVAVDYRHLYLIADYMTFPGVIKAMNRNWMKESVSPFLKMSFETSCNFLTEAASYREVDRMVTPSSQIAIGQAPSVGTGIFDLFMNLKFEGMEN